MCGICGIVGERNEALIQRMTRIMTHRGPDDEGYYLDDYVSLGVRRLAIIDLQTGHQPVANEDKTIWVILNGEIYNFQELRMSLEEKGHRFSTKTDTEVIVHSYEEYGFNCLEHFRGMFAFAIWDKRERLLFLARDRIGIKPLYYTECNGKLIFASEIKSILEYEGISRRMDMGSLDLYLTLQYVPAPGTLFKDIKKLGRGEYLVYKDRNKKINRYWDILLKAEETIYNIDEVKERLDSLLKESVKYRLISDVPVGVLLSGGVDSSAMVAYISQVSGEKVNTFTIGFGMEGEEYDESIFAKEVAKIYNTNHHEIKIMPDVVSILPRLIYQMDEPIADQAALPVYLLCKTAKDYVTVLITGEGGDELFAGYPRYLLNRIGQALEILPQRLRYNLLAVMNKIPILPGRIRGAAQKLMSDIPDVILKNIYWVSNFNRKEKEKLYKKGTSLKKESLEEFLRTINEDRRFKNWLDKLLYFDLNTWLVDDILMKVDKMSMAASVEARVPLLDHKLVEFVSSLSSDFKLKGLKTKFIFKEILKRYLPAEILSRSKAAFRIPSKEWIKNDWRELLKYHLLERTSSLHNYFNSDYIKELTINHLSGKEDNSQKLWNLLCLDIWHKMYIEGNKRFDYSYERVAPEMKSRGRQLLIAWDFPPQRGGIQTLLNSVYSPLGAGCIVIAPHMNGSYKFDLLSGNEIIRSGLMSNIPAIIGLPVYWLTSFLKTLIRIRDSKIRMVHCGHIRTGITGYFLKSFFKIPYIVWTYALEVTDKRFLPLTRLVLKNADRVITISNYTGGILKNIGIDDNKIEKIHPPINEIFLTPVISDESSREYVKNKYSLSDKKIILTVARLTKLQRYKGIDIVLSALRMVRKRCDDFYYIICGSGEMREYYLKLAEEYGLGNCVIIDGNVSDEELPLYYNACDIFIMVSREERTPRGILAEGFGIVFLEANACGKPVIGGRSGGIPDAVADGETGILVDPNNVEEIASAIVKLLTDEKLAEEMGRRGRERVLREFTIDNAVKKLKRVIDDVERR